MVDSTEQLSIHIEVAYFIYPEILRRLKKLGVSFEYFVAGSCVLVFNDQNLISIVLKNVQIFSHQTRITTQMPSLTANRITSVS